MNLHVPSSATITLEASSMSCLGPPGFPNGAPPSLPLNIPHHSSHDPSSVETFISDLLQAVTSDDVPVCSSCEEGASASSRCRDCSEMLCDPCVEAHMRVRLTKEHRIVRLSKDISSIPESISLGSSRTSNSPCSPSASASSNYCDIHHEPCLYCSTCTSAVCSECTLAEHGGHHLLYIQDAVEAARTSNVALSADARKAIAAVREAIDNVQRMSEAVEVRSHQAATDVRTIVKRYVAIIEERERELLARIEHMRHMKGKSLQSQMEHLRVALTKLARTSDLLTESLDVANGLDVIAMNERATNDMKQIRYIRSELVPCEDDSILFIPPDMTLLRAVSTLGTFSTSPTNNHALLRAKLKEQQQQHAIQPFPYLGAGASAASSSVGVEPPVKDEPLELLAQQQTAPPRGRPILGAQKPVVARIELKLTVPQVIGAEGDGDGQLCRPWGVCCDHVGHIIVADRSNNRIQVFNADGSFAHKFGVQGTGHGQFDRPAGVAVDPAGRVIVADKDNHRIQVLRLDGTFVHTFGEKGGRNGQFNYPWDVACNCMGHIVVSDTRNHRIQIFTNDGVYMNKYGFENTSPLWKHFDSPRGVCFTPNGSIIVTDFNNHRIVIIDHRFSQAQFLGCEGSGYKQFLRPQGIVCDDEGRIIVADSRNNRIQVFESNGNYLWKVGNSGKGLGELDRPSGICLNPQGRIVVVDFGNDRVQIF